jgi:hypothetical protein
LAVTVQHFPFFWQKIRSPTRRWARAEVIAASARGHPRTKGWALCPGTTEISPPGFGGADELGLMGGLV